MCNEFYRFLWPSDLQAELESLCLGHKSLWRLQYWTHGVLDLQGHCQYQKNPRRQSLTGKVFLDFRDKVLMEPIHKKKGFHPGLLLVQPKEWQMVFILSCQGWGISSSTGEGSPVHKLKYICTKQKSYPVLFFLQSWCLLLFITNKSPLWHFPLRIGHFCLYFKNLLKKLSFLLSDFLNGIRGLICSVLNGRSCFSCYLDLFKG